MKLYIIYAAIVSRMKSEFRRLLGGVDVDTLIPFVKSNGIKKKKRRRSRKRLLSRAKEIPVEKWCVEYTGRPGIYGGLPSFCAFFAHFVSILFYGRWTQDIPHTSKFLLGVY